jgi:hypothetical protein
MSPLILTVELVPLVAHTDKRAVAILRGDVGLTAGLEYDAVADTPVGKRLKHRMGLWISFHHDTPGKFHRFKINDVKYRDCFAFVDLDAQLRLYGFSCHPTPKTNAPFELIVLTNYAGKKETLTDTVHLNRVLIWKDSMATKLALIKKYPDKKDEKKS